MKMSNVIVNSLPKSGTHLAWEIVRYLKYEESRYHLSAGIFRGSLRPDPFELLVKKLQSLYFQSSQEGKDRCGVDLDNGRIYIDESFLFRILSGSNQAWKAHLPYSDSLSELIHDLEVKVINVIRDPRDVVISYFHHVQNDRRYPPFQYLRNLPFGEVINKLVEGDKGMRIPSLRGRLERFSGWVHDERFLLVRFEDLIKCNNPDYGHGNSFVLGKISAYLSADISDAQIINVNSETYRNPKIGHYKDLPEDQRFVLDNKLKPYIAEFGYEL